MPNPENLIGKGFQPGQSGNPEGRQLGSKNRSTIARKILEMRSILPADRMLALKAQFPEIADNMTVEEIMTIVMAEGAMSGDDKSYKAVMDSAYGAPKQEVDMDFKGELVIPAPVIYNTAPPLASNENEIDNV
jgi:hypothetical protein